MLLLSSTSSSLSPATSFRAKSAFSNYCLVIPSPPRCFSTTKSSTFQRNFLSFNSRPSGSNFGSGCRTIVIRGLSSIPSAHTLDWNESISCSEIGDGRSSTINEEEMKPSIPVRAYFFSTSINLRSLVDRNKANFIPPTSHMTDHPKPSQTILTQDLADELALVDAKPDKLRDAKPAYFSHRSDLCIVMAGAHQNTGESRPSLLHRNVALFRNIIQPLAQHSQDSILMIVSNSVDILTYVAWKLSRFPYNRVTGSGTNLDSSRFRRV